MRVPSPTQQGWVQLALATFIAAMLVVIATELMPSRAPAAAEAPPGFGPAIGSAAPASFRMPPLAAFSEVVARPLFSRTRRPGAATAALAASSTFTLVGIVISADRRDALLASGQPGRVLRVGEGQEIEGWTVDKILPDKVIVRHGDQREEVKARDAGAVPVRPLAGASSQSIVPVGNPPPVRRRAGPN